MKYETPELTALTPAINAIQTVSMPSKQVKKALDFIHPGAVQGNEPNTGYADWE
jgi:hypothetical protein